MVIGSCLGVSEKRKNKVSGNILWLKNKRIFCRSSHMDVFCKKGALKYLAKFTAK